MTIRIPGGSTPNRWSGRILRGRTRDDAGRAAETRALRFLERQGLRRLARNYRCRTGELDLVMDDGDCVVVVEVRARAAGAPVPAIETVDEFKQRKIISATEAWLARYDRYGERPVRFDVVTIETGHRGRAKLQWIKDAFRA